MSLLSNALAIHADRLVESAGEDLLVLRGGIEHAIKGVASETAVNEFGADGELRAVFKSVDFLVQPKNYKIEGEIVEPSRGDRIKRKNGDVFDLAQGSSGATWEWSDAHRTHYRIHTARRVKS